MVIGLPQFRSFRSPAAGGGSAAEGRSLSGRSTAWARGCDTVTVPLRHGLETVDILRLRRACGSVVQGPAGTVAFLVPAGTAERWQLVGTSCTPGAAALPATDPRWLLPPTGPELAPRPTDPWVLRDALCEAARTLAAGGLGPF
ncbi:hypothetical protein [Kitasatospora viridis]|uniref:Bifunctional DNA primase/polymerase-like protein n=1 Tax=Kitasatospora viridis TaxID=281105 RepID=A0A561UKL8_9ACTN|nr:hypothetical protein [Kitasatospora viridis]TWF99885.1 hypothetical protein FHX73_113745 [Kitasatospora viridis]